jgi:hypothetical protein
MITPTTANASTTRMMTAHGDSRTHLTIIPVVRSV